MAVKTLPEVYATGVALAEFTGEKAEADCHTIFHSIKLNSSLLRFFEHIMTYNISFDSPSFLRAWKLFESTFKSLNWTFWTDWTNLV
jgi:hypothetical protein